MNTVLPFRRQDSARSLTASERLQALLQASMNDDRADACSQDQPALRELLKQNAALLRQLANVRT